MRENWYSGFPTRSDTNRAVQAQKKARILKSGVYVEEELYYPRSENKGADQLCSFRILGKNPVFPYGVILRKDAHVVYRFLSPAFSKKSGGT